MATVKDIYCAMDEWAPFETQMDFDNAGFLVGRGEAKADKILVALDITQEVVEEAAKLGCQLIVSHHPVIFHPVKAVTDESVTGCTLLAADGGEDRRHLLPHQSGRCPGRGE